MSNHLFSYLSPLNVFIAFSYWSWNKIEAVTWFSELFGPGAGGNAQLLDGSTPSFSSMLAVSRVASSNSSICVHEDGGKFSVYEKISDAVSNSVLNL